MSKLGKWPTVQILRAILTLALCSACEGESDGRVQARSVSSVVIDSSGLRIITLSASPNDVATGRFASETLRSDLEYSLPDTTAHVADLAVFDDDRLAVLDRVNRSVYIYAPSGQILSRVGGAGSGLPLRDPLAITEAGGKLVILDGDTASVFTILDTTGKLLASVPKPIEGDWMRFSWRMPYIRWEWPFQHGPEDVTTRLQSYLGGYVHFVQPDEYAAFRVADTAWFRSPKAALVFYDLRGRLVDTLLTLPGARLVVSRDRGPNRPPQFVEPFFEPRPVWATGADWLAAGDGRQPRINIRDTAGVTKAVIRWPDSRRAVSDTDRLVAVTWFLHYITANKPNFRNEWRRKSDRARRKFLESSVPLHLDPMYRGSTPSLTKVWGQGKCLWLAGFAPDDSADATALTLVGVDLQADTILALIRVPQRGARLRFISRNHLYTVTMDSLGIETVTRYRMPGSNC